MSEEVPPAVEAAIRVDLGSLQRSRSGAILGRVAIVIGGVAFPELDWADVVVVVLGWWCAECVGLLRGARDAELLFMEGPYVLQLTAPTHQRWAARFLLRDMPWAAHPEEVQVRAVDFLRSLETASAGVLRACAVRRWESRDIAVLRSWLTSLGAGRDSLLG